jgi:hypothetical protein
MNFNVEEYWAAVAKKAEDNRTWHQLPPQHQQMVIQSINMLLMVLTDKTVG